MKRFSFSALALLIASFGACASAPPPRYVKAQPQREPPRMPAVIEVPKPLPLPGQLKPLPSPEARRKVAAASDPKCEAQGFEKGRGKRNNAACNDVASVIRKANERASQAPTERGFFNAIQVYDYVSGALYQVYTAPLRLTVIQLQPGERLVGKPATGDSTRWVAGQGRSLQNGVEQQHVFIKPVFPGQDTSLVLLTDRRTYFLELHSLEEDAMASVSWRYPQDEIVQYEAQAAQQEALSRNATGTNVSLERMNFAYQIKVAKGKPIWTPLQVFDDGAKTFVRFPAAMLYREAPALFVVSGRGETNYVNYRVKNDIYIVDRLFDQAELRVGQKNQEIVRITRHR